jgi:hypothetical protein
MASQQSAPFFKLSAELRVMVYRAVLGDHAIYIVHLLPKDTEGSSLVNPRYGRLGCLKSKLSADQSLIDTQPLWPEFYMKGWWYGKQNVLSSIAPDGELVHLLKTCKLVLVNCLCHLVTVLDIDV